MGKARIVTTSWDDGDPNDLKVAELLHSRGLTGTFYVPISSFNGGKILEDAELRSLRAGGFEIGAHGVTHTVLTQLSPGQLVREVRVCKRRLEDVLSGPVEMFCYPKGKHNAKVIKQVKQAGYRGARTARMLSQHLSFNPYQMPTSLLAEPRSKECFTKNLARALNVKGLYEYLTHYMHLDSWVAIGKTLFDQVMREGGVWHLYGHSGTIAGRGLWGDLEEMLDYVSHRESVAYLPNCDVLNYLPTQPTRRPTNSSSFMR
jgi:peptidoglycan/xylan/chitin deacetylase (PgdA/CDA1 family)